MRATILHLGQVKHRQAACIPSGCDSQPKTGASRIQRDKRNARMIGTRMHLGLDDCEPVRRLATPEVAAPS